jgi:hypothetical protein
VNVTQIGRFRRSSLGFYGAIQRCEPTRRPWWPGRRSLRRMCPSRPNGCTNVSLKQALQGCLIAAVLASCATSSRPAGDAGPDGGESVPWPRCRVPEEQRRWNHFECDLGSAGVSELTRPFSEPERRCVCEPPCPPACPSPPYPWLRVVCNEEDSGCEIRCGPDQDCGPGWVCDHANLCTELIH